MNYPYRLLAPGPVQIPEYARQILAAPMIHHRAPQFIAELEQVFINLKKVFFTDEPVYILSSTGSGAMEAAIANTLSPGDRVITVDAGKFGERWAKMASLYQLKVETIHVTWGESVTKEQIEHALAQFPDTKAVLMQATETSTGALQPVKEIAAAVKKYPDCLFIVDAITSVLSTDLRMDDWSIDVVVAGSQKAFMLPTGLSFISLSKKAQAVMSKTKCANFYFDLKAEQKAYALKQTKFSSSVAEIRALHAILTKILENGISSLTSEIQKRARITRIGIEALGLTTYPTTPSPSLTVVNVPDTLDGKKLRRHIEETYNITFMGGQDQLEGKIIRIGHLGDISQEDVVASIEFLGKALNDFGYKTDWQSAVAKVLREYEA
ncbi:MAG: alanine--glyoxylate aminotransferase family protein [Bdellovibrionales bacterium]|nr:alanine--glyoxylate aminotransferase family protein [Bdellovibrionales bacterium]